AAWRCAPLRSVGALGLPWQRDLQRGTVALLAVRPAGPAALLDDTVDRGEPESRTAPRPFGREKGLEQARLGRAIHAHARVADGEQHVRAWLGRHMRRDVAPTELDIRRFNRETASLWHGVPGIHHQIHDRLLELARIGSYRPHRS